MTDPASKTQTKAAIQSRAWREKNQEQYRAGIKKANDERRSDPVKWARKLEQNRQSNKRNLEKRKAGDRARDPVKRRARSLVRQRVWRKTLSRGFCEICGAPNADAHHEDYSKPLHIRWLCTKHHAEEHHV